MAWIDLIGDITINWDSGFTMNLRSGISLLPLLLYCFAPAYMKLIRRHPILLLAGRCYDSVGILVQYVTPSTARPLKRGA